MQLWALGSTHYSLDKKMNTMMQTMYQQRYRLMKRMDQFTTDHPYAGPVFWILAVQYFVVQLIVANAWPRTYDWSVNLISDLGAVQTCGQLDDRYVCSPLSWLMNLSFITFGVTIALGAFLIYTQFKRTKVSRAGFILMILSGIGTVGVGLFPLDTHPVLHQVGAVPALLLGNVAIILLAQSLAGLRPAFRIYTYATGIVSVVAFILFAAGVYFGLGAGGMERVISYPFAVWMLLFGIYMTIVRVRS